MEVGKQEIIENGREYKIVGTKILFLAPQFGYFQFGDNMVSFQKKGGQDGHGQSNYIIILFPLPHFFKVQ